MSDRAANLPPILPVGTTIVALVPVRGADGRPVHSIGTVATIVAAPTDPEHSYRVRFPGGDDHALKRRQFQVLRAHLDPSDPLSPDALSRDQFASDPLGEHDLRRHVVYRCVIGSRAYGLERDDSDCDRRGVYLPPASMHWSVYGVPPQIEDPQTQECHWEIERFIRLALKANPNVLETLWTPIVELLEPVVAPLREERSIFLSKLIFQTFNGYAVSQFRKMQSDLRTKGTVKWKHAMHLIRLLRAGIGALRTGELPVRVEPAHRDELLAIRDGALEWESIDRLRLKLHEEFASAFTESALPERPDYARANEFLVAARAEMARREGLA